MHRMYTLPCASPTASFIHQLQQDQQTVWGVGFLTADRAAIIGWPGFPMLVAPESTGRSDWLVQLTCRKLLLFYIW